MKVEIKSILAVLVMVSTVCSNAKVQKASKAKGIPQKLQKGALWQIDLGDEVVMELVPIEAGSFLMGSEDGADDERPVHRVTFSNSFWLAKTETTQLQYCQIMDCDSSEFRDDNHPVRLSWYDAMEFCKKLTTQERLTGHLPEGYEYTLPTEAQWEYACRAGISEKYCYGGEVDSLDDFANYKGSPRYGRKKKMAPAGKHLPNAWGLYDMHGNVWEWCLNCDGAYPFEKIITHDNIHCGCRRIMRGGGYLGSSEDCRSANRARFYPIVSAAGFRVCLVRKVDTLPKKSSAVEKGSIP